VVLYRTRLVLLFFVLCVVIIDFDFLGYFSYFRLLTFYVLATPQYDFVETAKKTATSAVETIKEKSKDISN
jgi:hypothetical protein